MNFREIHYEFRSNSLYRGIYFRENRFERPLVGEVGLNSERNEDQPFSPSLWHKPGLMVMGQGRGALVPVRAWNQDQKVQTNWDQWPTWLPS